MVFDHVADCPGIVVELPPAFDPELLCHCDLHTLDVIPVPAGFEKAVTKAKEQKIENALFAKVVVNPKDSRLWKHRMNSPIQLLCRGEIAPGGLVDNHTV